MAGTLDNANSLAKERRESLLAAYRALPDDQQWLVELLAFLYVDVPVLLLLPCIKHLREEEGASCPYDWASLAAVLDELCDEGLLVRPENEVYHIVRALADSTIRSTLGRRSIKTIEGFFSAPSILFKMRDGLPFEHPFGLRGHSTSEPMLVSMLRLCVYGHNYPTIERLLGSQIDDPWEPHLAIVAEPIFETFNNEWFGRLPVTLRATLLRRFLVTANCSLQPVGDHDARLKQVCDEPGIEQWHGYPGGVAEMLVLSGRFTEARNLLSKHSDWHSLSVKGWLDVIEGNYATAQKNYERGLRALYKQWGSQTVYFPTLAGVFYLLLLIRSRGGKNVYTVERCAGRVHEHSGYSGLYQLLVRFARERELILKSDDFRSRIEPDHANGLEEWLRALILYWAASDELFKQIDALEALSKRAWRAGCAWLGKEITTLVRRLQGKERGPHAVRIALADMVQRSPGWRERLGRVQALLSRQRPATTRPATTRATIRNRVAWLLKFQNNHCRMRPMLQSLNRRDKWTKGKSVSFKILPDTLAELDYALPHDHAIVRGVHIKKGDPERVDSYQFSLDRQAMLRAMAGHPYLFWDKSSPEPVSLTRAQPILRVVQDGRLWRLAMQPRIPRERPYKVFLEGEDSLVFYELTDEQASLTEVIKNLTVPHHGLSELLDVLRASAHIVPVCADGVFEWPGRVAADRRLYAKLVPFGMGLKISLWVRPLGRTGPALRPGQDGASVVCTTADGLRSTVRDLARERQLWEMVQEQCQSLGTLTAVADEWRLTQPEECLQALVELRALDGQLVLEWPHGQNFDIIHVDEKQLEMQVHSFDNSFYVTGRAQLNDHLVELRDLMAMVGPSATGFAPISPGRFLALTDNLRAMLGQLRTMTEDHQRGRRIGSVATSTLRALLEETSTVVGDASWQDSLRRLDEVRDFQPQVPAGLQAELRAYQRQGFAWLARLARLGLGACLADDMGLGKTVQALALLLERAENGPVLVVAPASVCGHWAAEARKFAPTLKPVVFAKGEREAIVANLRPMDLLICSYGILQNEAKLLSTVQWCAVILDEAQAIKNVTSKRTKAAMRLRGEFKMVTTGTPIENHLGELWSIFQFINPGLLGTRRQFRERFARPIEASRDVTAGEALGRLVKPFLLRRQKSDVLAELPARTEQIVRVQLSAEEIQFYEDIRVQALNHLSEKGSDVTHVQVLAQILRLRQVCCHPRLIDPQCEIAGSKLAALRELLLPVLASGHKVLVFSQFLMHLQIVRELLETQRVTYQYLDGSTAMAERQKRIAAFQGGDGDVFLISLRAGGVGIDLTAADYVIHLDPWWNPAVEDQASDRAHRIGQTRPVTVYRLIAQGTIEERIVAMHEDKRDLAARLLAGRDVVGSLSVEELLALIRDLSGSSESVEVSPAE